MSLSKHIKEHAMLEVGSSLSLFSTSSADGVKTSFTITIPAGLTFVQILGHMAPGNSYAVGLRFNGDTGANYDWTSLDYAQTGNALTPLSFSTAGFTAVPANGTSEQTVTVNGLVTTDTVLMNKLSYQAGLGIVNTRVSAANTLAIEYMNNSASPITPTSETCKVYRFPNPPPISKNDTTGDTALHIGPGLGGHSILQAFFTIPALTAAQHRVVNAFNIEDAATIEKHDHYGRWNSNAAITSVTLFNVFGLAFNTGTVFELFGKQ